MPEKILVIEDNEQNRILMRQILTYRGYDVLEAADGLTGLEMARAHTPALILLDIQMPVMNGFMVIRELRNNPELRKIKVIAVTSFAMKGDRERRCRLVSMNTSPSLLIHGNSRSWSSKSYLGCNHEPKKFDYSLR
jgi:CheY-like chemotaxis protein